MHTYKVIIIGSGFGGITAAVNLSKQGISDFRILERRSFMGGTWCQNTYPGAAVDVQSPLYSLSFESYPWSQMFAEQDELEDYTHYVIAKYKIRSKTDLSTNVAQIEWDEKEQLWIIKITDGKVYKSQFVINASGPLSTPVVPPFEGKESFEGVSFHTNNWDHSFDHKGKKVAIIGSGASAVQVIPAIADEVEQLYVFQRTPHWVLPRHDRQFSRFQQKLLKKKWAYQLLRSAIYWGLETRVIAFKYFPFLLKILAESKAKRHLRKQVEDSSLREKLTPDFRIGCKRILLSNTLYPALCRENVTLLDKSKGIKEITARGITTLDQQEMEVDLIVYATGYDATDGMISYPVIGKNGQTLLDAWSVFPRAYLGTALPNFPNFFIVTGPNTGIGHTSALFVIESQMLYIIKSIVETLKGNFQSMEVKKEAEEDYTTMIHKEMERTVWHTGGCQSWYKSKSGKVIAMFPGFTFTYRRLAKAFKPSHHNFYRNKA